MTDKQLRQLGKQINNDKDLKIAFIFNSPEYFCYQPNNNTIYVSSFYYRLKKYEIVTYLTHEIGHMNTVNNDSLLVTDYSAEYEANKWAINRLTELNWTENLYHYKSYLLEMVGLVNEEDEQYKEAAIDLLAEMEVV